MLVAEFRSNQERSRKNFVVVYSQNGYIITEHHALTDEEIDNELDYMDAAGLYNLAVGESWRMASRDATVIRVS